MTSNISIKGLILAFVISSLGMLSTYFLSVQVGNQLKNKEFLKLENIAKQVSIRFQDAINISLNDMQSLQAFYSVKTEVKHQDEFNHYMHLLDIEKRTYIQALSWVPLVKDIDRESFEKHIKASQSNFAIKERSPQGKLVVSALKPYYTPVTYISPYNINKLAQGFDLNSNNVRRTSLEYARDTGRITTTAKIKLVQEQGDSYGFLLIAPVFTQGSILNNSQERRKALLGYATGVYRINTLMEKAQEQALQEGLILNLFDLDKNNGGLLYGTGKRDNVFNFDIKVPDRDWSLGISLNDTLTNSINSPPIVHWIFVMGSLMSLLLAVALYALHISRRKSVEILTLSKQLTHQNQALEKTVDERTLELKAKNSVLNTNVEELVQQRKVLSSLIDESHKAKVNAEQRAKELARSNKDLDDFAYIASHDLKAPLRGIDQLASWVAEDIQDGNDEEVLTNVAIMRSRVQRLESLLNDLLTYSRANRQDDSLRKVDCNKMVNELFTLTSPPKGFLMTVDNPLPIFVTANAPLEQVFLNLFNNAIKHHNKNEGNINVQCIEQNSFYLFKVKDDGPGIHVSHQEEVFKMFKTLKPRDEVEGSGMGLALVKKVIEHHAGQIYVESVLGQSSTFCFTWPKKLLELESIK